MSIINTVRAYIDEFNACDIDPHAESRNIPNGAVFEWMLENVPLVELDDKVVERVYYFRWWTYRKHIRLTDEGYIISEFLFDVPWSGKYNAISCAAWQHLYEGRWIKNSTYIDDYLRYWIKGGGSLRSYSCPIADAAYNRYLVTGEADILAELFDGFAANYYAWKASNLDETGLFWQLDERDGMELTLGGSGLRPAINSYMYAEASAISKIAAMLGKAEYEDIFRVKAETIKRLMHEILWDNEVEFFKTFATGAAAAKHRELYGGWLDSGWEDSVHIDQPSGLSFMIEQMGYTPWYFDIPGASCDAAWKYLTDSRYFSAEKGITTASMCDPSFMTPHKHECAWDGASWPFSTYITLKALGMFLRRGENAYVTTADYWRLLRQYADAHVLNTERGQIPFIDESYHPHTGEWISRAMLYARNNASKDRGMYYNHSAFCDLVLTEMEMMGN